MRTAVPWLAGDTTRTAIPSALAVAFGDLLADALQHRALASSEGRPRPMAVPEHTFGHPNIWVDLGTSLTPGFCRELMVPSFVPRGNGAPMGLSQHDLFSWARTQGHPAEDVLAQVIRRYGAQSTTAYP